VSVTALFMPFSSPNVISTVYDIAPPEVRATASGLQYLIESVGAATAPLLAGLIAVRASLQDAILVVSEGAWLACGLLIVVAIYLLPDDIEALRRTMQRRAQAEGVAAGDTA
jgi:MFS family permease